MPIYKIIIPVIALIFIFKWLSSFFQWKRSWREVFFWIFFWWFFGFIGAYPQIIEIFAKFTWIQDSVKAFFMLMIMLLIFVILHMIMMIERLDRDLTKVIRKISLDEAEKNLENKN